MVNVPHFTHFAAIDWSGAKGNRHKGIAVALCTTGRAAPILISPPDPRGWSRQAVADWLTAQAASTPTLFGFDFSFAPPLIQRGSYLPGETVPDTATAFWAYVDAACPDPDLGAASFLETLHRRHFYFGIADGVKADFLHNRACEHRYNDTGGSKLSTVYDAIGAAQVAKASFAGMRLLHQVNAQVPVWPFDPKPGAGSLIVEIYTSIAARAAGQPKNRSKIRDPETLDRALVRLDSEPHIPLPSYDDHATDAIVTAAWLRHVQSEHALWSPPGLTSRIARTEGWTYGIL